MADTVLPTKRTRRSGPKSSSGCATCKKRRIKCDERLPHCMRCEKFGMECGGYKKLPSVSTAPKNVVARPLLPNAKVLCKPPATVSKLFNTDQEFGYFQRFCMQNVKQLTGLRESEFWTRYVLQASEMEPCVRHAVIAIGALDFSKKGFGPGAVKRSQRDSSQISDSELFDASRLEFACQEYGKAIACLRTTIAKKKLSVRTSLITSLLFVCFESYHGNSDGASAQIYAGIEVLEQYKKQRQRLSVEPDKIPPPPIENDIVDMFAMLEVQATSWGDNRGSGLHLQRMRECEASIGEFPKEFKDLGHASRSVFLIALRGIHLRLSQSNEDALASGMIRGGIMTLGPLVSGPRNSELLSVMAMFAGWVAAYQPFLRRATGQDSSKERRNAALMLYSHYLSIHVWVASGSSDIDSYYRCYTKELREIVELSKDMSYEHQDYFTLDHRIVMPLQVVAMSYRHRALRQEIITIFSRLPRREGVWDASMIVKILQWISTLEEEGLTDEEYVPEDVFATLTELKVDAENNIAFVQCVQGVRGCPGQTVLKETTVSW
ncbi:hypothetical protein VTL71DRAFT_4862 [Oculimacula yallundae]|uniref:Zn(2)-C6 fungal-type domain-containing protein n=1 Tax=Oculimacula yallundae TaxID=86028 RepID=A0ABR4C3B2_9HELO